MHTYNEISSRYVKTRDGIPATYRKDEWSAGSRMPKKRGTKRSCDLQLHVRGDNGKLMLDMSSKLVM